MFFCKFVIGSRDNRTYHAWYIIIHSLHASGRRQKTIADTSAARTSLFSVSRSMML